MEKWYVIITDKEYGEFAKDLEKADYADYKIVDKNDSRYCLIKEVDLNKFIEKNHKYQDLYDKLNDGHNECYNCGCISNKFYMDYRGETCISKVYNCLFCHSLNDEHYKILGDKRNIEQYI